MHGIRTPLIAGTLTVAAALMAVPTALASHTATQGVAPNCARSELGVRSNGSSGAAGTVHGAWVMTNLSTRTCKLTGYPILRLYGRTGRPIRITQRHNIPPGARIVTLTPHTSATFFTSYSDVPSGSMPCPISAVMQVESPGPLFIPAQLQPCRHVVSISGFRAGVHHA